MYCHSRVSYSEMISNIQDAHYLRIPLLLNTQLFQGRDFSFYVGAGMEASKLLYAKEGGVRLKDDNIYCSATALAGFRYNVTPDVGITLEPIYSHTFLPIEKPVLTTLTDKPDLFSKLIVKVLFPLFSFAQVWGKKKEYDPKPSPDGVKGIAEELGVSLDEVLYIGDSDVDVYTAKNASVRFCGVSWGFRSVEELRSAGASVIADTPEDILRIVRSSGVEK